MVVTERGHGAGEPDRDDTIGVVGVGDMGGGIAHALLKAGRAVVVHDVRPEPVASLVEAGAIACASVADVVTTRAAVVALVVLYDEQLRDVVRAAIEAAPPRTVLVAHSTVLPGTVVALAAEAAAARGIALVDAPVSGGSEKATLGSLTVMVGGEDVAVARCRPLLDTIGANVFHVGGIGAGQVMKLTNNALGLGGYALALEAMQLAAAYGIDEDTATEVMVVSQGDSKHVRTWGRMDRLRRDHTLAGTPAVYDHFSYVLTDAAIAGAQRDRVLPLFAVTAQVLPTKMMARDRELATLGALPDIPRCPACGHELSRPYRAAGVHPECYGDDRPAPEVRDQAGDAGTRADVGTVGLIGAGDMGGAYRARCAAGIALLVHDVRPAAVEGLVRAGATGATSVADVVGRSQVVAIVVTDDEQLHGVVREALAAARPGTILVVHSTVLPTTVIDLAAEAAARGVTVVDAPISGGSEKAELGALTVMAGGDADAVAACRPLFDAIGHHVVHLGPVGAGQAMKLANNALSNGLYTMVLEAMELAAAYGIDEDTVTAIVSVSQGDSRHIRTWGRMDRLRRTHTLAGTPELYEHMARDLRIATGAGARRDLDLALFATIAELAPRKAAARDRELDAAPPRSPLPVCSGCGHELAAPFRAAGRHPECRA